MFFFTRKLYIWYLDRPASQQAKQTNQNIDNSSRNSNNKKLIRYKRLLHCCDGGGGGGGSSGSCWYCLHFVSSLAATHSNVANFFSGSKSCKRDLSTMLTGFLVTFNSMNHNNNDNNMNCWSSRQANFFYSCINCVLLNEMLGYNLCDNSLSVKMMTWLKSRHLYRKLFARVPYSIQFIYNLFIFTMVNLDQARVHALNTPTICPFICRHVRCGAFESTRVYRVYWIWN